ncbi:MAG: hypothetical protein HN445_00890 [Bacteroidetes Order II. Incertae sedis bacterium]|nr:hypothetical protein [Bacteroidetes Order II. bacterium]
MFAASLLTRESAAKNKLGTADKKLAIRVDRCFPLPLFPILVTGRREGIAHSILRGLKGGVSRVPVQSKADQKLVTSLNRRIANGLKTASFIDHGIVLSIIDDLESLTSRTGSGGLFLVVDELGKLLEHASLHPEKSDVYLLQLLAERSIRRQSDGAGCFLFVTILHQAIERYATRLASGQKDEWKKVQGRFEDFAFVEPVDETIRLLSLAVSAKLSPGRKKYFSQEAARTLKVSRLSSYLNLSEVEATLIGAAPLSPVVSLLVGPIFRKLAQNERSLFAFLASQERHGFVDVLSRQQNESKLLRYGLEHLFDYLMTTIGPTLLHGRDSLFWAEAETVIQRCEGGSPLQIPLIKIISLIGYVGSFVGLRANSEVLSIVLGVPQKEIDCEVEKLVMQKLISFRPFDKEYVLWQGSDFDLEHWLKQARASISNQISVAELLTQSIVSHPLMARRHAYQTGTSRFVEAIYVSDTNWFVEAQKNSEWADGKMLFVVASSEDSRNFVLASLQDISGSLPSNVIVSVLSSVAHIRSAAFDILCFDWISKNCDQLSGDPAARKELNQRRIDAAAYVSNEIAELTHRRTDDDSPNWLLGGELISVCSPRDLQNHLSKLFDKLYCSSPRIWNELLNRKKPSASAVSATKLLLKAMVNNADKSALGISGTPAEYGLYASILNKGELHRQQQDVLGFSHPKADPLRIQPLYNAFEAHLVENHGEQVGLGELLSVARREPFGLRKGLFPVLVMAFIMARRNEVAIYEDSVLLIDFGQYEIDRFVKDPSRFSLQLIKIDGDRSLLLELLGQVVGLDSGQHSVLQIVTELLRKARSLTPYARRTGDLSSRDTAVREALFRAEDPIKLLFEDLPISCGGKSELVKTHPETYQKVSLELQASLRSITNAYSSLLYNLHGEFADALHLRSKDPEGRRSEIVERSKPLLEHATNDKFRAFLVRATDSVMDTATWFESLAALLTDSPPKHWLDRTRIIFRENLREISRSYRTLEPLVFGEKDDHLDIDQDSVLGTRKRVSVTTLGAEEQAYVFSLHLEDEPKLQNEVLGLKKQLETGRGEKDIKFKLAVVSKLLEQLLIESELPETTKR